MGDIKRIIRRATPASVLSAYHRSLAYLGALIYRFPSRHLIVIGVTGTNGKSSTTEFINSIFEEAGYKTALSNSIRWKVGDKTTPSTGRSMPGRFFIQRLMRQAVSAGCDIAIVEMTSEGAKQHRHRCIDMNCLVFLNLAPEHIESHGSLEAYADAKFELGRQLERSRKRPRIMLANADDPQSARYLALPLEQTIPFTTRDLAQHTDGLKSRFNFGSEQITVQLPGTFYVQNALAAAEVARVFNIDAACIKRGIERVERIPGRMERIEEGQKFEVVVDYALTPDALEALYKTFADKKKICVFGSAGGGRDTWKRPVLGKIAGRHCAHTILTNDIAYDEPPQKILNDIANGMNTGPEIIPDRRLAIRRAVELAQKDTDSTATVVLLTGMGVDTEISAPDGTKVPWNEAEVVREELRRAHVPQQV